MAWKRSSVRSRPGPPLNQQLTDSLLFGLVAFGSKFCFPSFLVLLTSLFSQFLANGIDGRSPAGERVPLGNLAQIRELEGPAEISRLDGSRVLIVEGDVRGRDIGSFIQDTRRLFDENKINLPTGYRVEFGGQFENLERARKRLLIVVPLSLFLIFLLLFNSLRQALLVFSGIPLAIVGGVFALLTRGMHFSISAGVGFIALFGIAVLNGVVMVSYINDLRESGMPLYDSVRWGALVRLRPVLMTALVASLGFIPMSFRPAQVSKCNAHWQLWSSADCSQARF